MRRHYRKIRGTRKLGCPVRIYVYELVKFPQFRVSVVLSYLCTYQRDMMNVLRDCLIARITLLLSTKRLTWHVVAFLTWELWGGQCSPHRHFCRMAFICILMSFTHELLPSSGFSSDCKSFSSEL